MVIPKLERQKFFEQWQCYWTQFIASQDDYLFSWGGDTTHFIAQILLCL